jgi:UDP-GlcNAc:undecaprenyl-phosphate GlcNAc-1-phosphate transferase
MKIQIIYGIIAFCVSALVMPAMIKISKRVGAISEVGGRHIGDSPIGRFGGVGVLLGIAISLGLQSWYDPVFRLEISINNEQIGGFFVGVTIVSVLGFLDDIIRLAAGVKFAVQIIAALIAYCCNLRVVGLDLLLFEPFQFGYLSMLITVVWIVGVVNAVNLIDGLDGLAGGVIFFASIVNLVAAIGAQSVVPAALMIALGGAILGFLLYNWHPAKIYMGDCGAYSIGFILAASGLLAPGQKASTGVALLIPLLALGLPIFDTLLTMLRRFMNQQGIFSPDRGHLHHILLDSGISHRRVVIGLYAICCVLCSLALLIVLSRNREVGYYFLVVSVMGILFWGRPVKSQLRRAIRKIIK